MPVHQINAQDEAHLGLISVFHYVLAGLYLLGIGFVIIHFMIMSMVFRMAGAESGKSHPAPVAVIAENPATETPGEMSGLLEIPPPATAPPTAPNVAKPNPFPKEIIPFFIGIYVVIGLFMVTLCVVNILSGLYIRKYKNRTFSFIVAAVNCLQIPLGTLLGVFTIIVLSRVSVKMEYDAKLAA